MRGRIIGQTEVHSVPSNGEVERGKDLRALNFFFFFEKEH